MIKTGFNRGIIQLEYKVEKLRFTIDIALIPKRQSPDAKYKGIMIELNGPTHYFTEPKNKLNSYT